MADERIKYACTGCGAEGCKLFRQYQTFAEHIRLLCVLCAQRDQRQLYDPNASCWVGNLCAAVPDETGTTFWSFTSVPQAGCDWWDALPLIAPAPTAPGDGGAKEGERG